MPCKDVAFRSFEPYLHEDGSNVFRLVFKAPTGTIGVVVACKDGKSNAAFCGWSHTKKRGNRKLSHSARDYFKDFASDAVEAFEQWKKDNAA